MKTDVVASAKFVKQRNRKGKIGEEKGRKRIHAPSRPSRAREGEGEGRIEVCVSLGNGASLHLPSSLLSSLSREALMTLPSGTPILSCSTHLLILKYSKHSIA